MALDRLTQITSSGISSTSTITVSAVAGVVTATTLSVTGSVTTGLDVSGIVTATTVQVGSATTIHTTGIDLGGGTLTSHNINSTGIITATGGFVGAVTGNVTGDLSGNVSGTAVTATTASFTNATISGDLTVQGTTTTLDTTLTEVDKLEVGANNTTVGVAITQSGTGDILRLYDSGTQVVTVADGGSFGIGTTIPATKLNVIGDTRVEGYSNAKIQIKRTGNTVANGSIEFLGSDNSFGWGLIANYDAGGSNFNIKEGSNSRLYIKSGNVGIGTDNPTGKVQITGSSGSRALTVNAPTLGPYITFETNGTPFADIGSEAGTVGSGTNDLLVLNARGARDLAFRTNSSERLRITSSGFVGINTDAPEVRLHVNESTGDGTARSLAIFQKDHTSGSITGNMASNGYPHTLVLENQDTSSDGGLTSLCFSKYTSGAQSQAVIAGISQSPGNMDLTFNVEFNNTIGERLRITSSGIISINRTTTTGNNRLQIYGSNNDEAFVRLKRINGAGDDSAYGGINVVDNNDVTIGSAEFRNQDSTTRSQFVLSTYNSGSLNEVLRIKANGEVRVPDNGKFTCGTDGDTKLYFDGTDTIIDHTSSSGTLRLRGDAIALQTTQATPETYILCNADSSVQLYHNNSEKLSTTSGGINVTGQVVSDGLVVDGGVTLTNTDAPQLVLKDSDSNSSAARIKLEAHGSDNVVDWFIGHTSTSNNSITFRNEDNQPIYFGTNGSNRVELSAAGHWVPQADNTYDLGLAGNRWRNIYTADLQMSNEGSQNDIDGTWGKYTIQEGENDLFLINRRTGKKYTFVLREVE